MPPQEQSSESGAIVSEDAMPKWFKLLFRTYAVLLLLGAVFVAVQFGMSIVLQAGSFSSFFSELPSSSTNLFAIGFYVLAALVVTLTIAYGVGLFRLRRWSLPILLFFVISSSLVNALGVFRGNYANEWELIGRIVPTIIILGIGYGAWLYRAAFSGSARKLWLQISLLMILVPVLMFSALAQIYIDDDAINDSDLLLPNVAILSEADNAFFALPQIDTLSLTERSAFDQAREYYRALEQGENVDIDAARSVLDDLTEITDRFIEASRKSGYQCPSLVNTHDIDTVICRINELRNTTQVVALRSYVEAAQGNTEEALESAYAPARLGKLVSAEQPSIIEHLVGIAFVKTGVESVGRIVGLATTSLSAKTSSAIIRELELYELDGSSLVISLKREYMSQKEMLRPFEPLSGYTWHNNSTNNKFAESARRNIEVVKAQCGDDLGQKISTVEASIDEERRSPLWWTLIKPNSIGEILRRFFVVSLGSSREKECEVNEISEMLQKRLQTMVQSS